MKDSDVTVRLRLRDDTTSYEAANMIDTLRKEYRKGLDAWIANNRWHARTIESLSHTLGQIAMVTDDPAIKQLVADALLKLKFTTSAKDPE